MHLWFQPLATFFITFFDLFSFTLISNTNYFHSILLLKKFLLFLFWGLTHPSYVLSFYYHGCLFCIFSFLALLVPSYINTINLFTMLLILVSIFFPLVLLIVVTSCSRMILFSFPFCTSSQTSTSLDDYSIDIASFIIYYCFIGRGCPFFCSFLITFSSHPRIYFPLWSFFSSYNLLMCDKISNMHCKT